MNVNVNCQNKITIGMPVYNGALFIREALDSMLAQSFTDFELIISDNCSNDETEKICRYYAANDGRIRYIRHSINRGALFNFNFVLREARFEYFMWAACDDRWSINWISSLLDKLKTTNKSNISSFGKVIQIDESSKVIEHHSASRNKFNFYGGLGWRQIKFYFEFEGDGKANLFYSLFRTAELERFDVNEYSKDYYAIFDMLNTISFHSVDNALLYKRIHSDGAGCESALSLKRKLIKFVTMQSVLESISNSFGYLKYSNGLIFLSMFLLIPLKVIYTHYRYIYRIVRGG
jgi:glycosyltransferase involved in cell wall biosynthesis